jgi:hypothetical protein
MASPGTPRLMAMAANLSASVFCPHIFCQVSESPGKYQQGCHPLQENLGSSFSNTFIMTTQDEDAICRLKQMMQMMIIP